MIAAFEDYPYTRYGIDAVALWPRLVPILREKKYLDFVADQKAHFDFMLNMMLIILVCGMEFFYLQCYLGKVIVALVSLPAMIVLLFLFYMGTISSAVEWGLTVRVAFDLHRQDLWDALYLKPATTFTQEFARWKKISEFIIYGNDRLDFDDFTYLRDSTITEPEISVNQRKGVNDGPETATEVGCLGIGTQ